MGGGEGGGLGGGGGFGGGESGGRGPDMLCRCCKPYLALIIGLYSFKALICQLRQWNRL